MVAEPEKSPQEQIMEGVWSIALQSVVILFAAAFGVFIGYQLWGDAPELKVQVETMDKQIIELKNEREAQSGRQALCDRDKDDFKKRLDKAFEQKNECQRELSQLKGGGQ
jgi:hypothetical protein